MSLIGFLFECWAGVLVLNVSRNRGYRLGSFIRPQEKAVGRALRDIDTLFIPGILYGGFGLQTMRWVFVILITPSPLPARSFLLRVCAWR